MAIDTFIQTDTKQSRVQSFAFVIVVGVCFLFCFSFGVSSLLRAGGTCEVELESRINPNDAPAASLLRLPGIGVSRAGAIVTYRENFVGRNGDESAFQNRNDLQKVKGIGPKTVQNISQWLKFE